MERFLTDAWSAGRKKFAAGICAPATEMSTFINDAALNELVLTAADMKHS